MNPPGDTDTDGSPSNCTSFFISAVHDLSLYETHAHQSAPPHTTKSIFPSPSVSCTASTSVAFFAFCSPPSSLFDTPVPPLYFWLSLFLSSSLRLFVCVSLLLLWTPPTHPHLPSLAGSLFSADLPLVSSGLAGRQQKWLWDWGMAALLSLTHRATLMSLQLHTYRVDRGMREEKKKRGKKKRQQNFVDSYYYIIFWTCSIMLGFRDLQLLK